MKKLLALLLVLSMSVSLAACGGNKTEEPAASGGNASEDASGEADADGGAQATAGDDLTWGLTPFEEPQTLRLGFFTGSPLSYPFLFADNLGVFDALNIEVEYTCFTGGPAMISHWSILRTMRRTWPSSRGKILRLQRIRKIRKYGKARPVYIPRERRRRQSLQNI